MYLVIVLTLQGVNNMIYTDSFRDSTTPWLVFITLRQKQLGNMGEGGKLGLTFTHRGVRNQISYII